MIDPAGPGAPAGAIREGFISRQYRSAPPPARPPLRSAALAPFRPPPSPLHSATAARRAGPRRPRPACTAPPPLRSAPCDGRGAPLRLFARLHSAPGRLRAGGRLRYRVAGRHALAHPAPASVSARPRAAGARAQHPARNAQAAPPHSCKAPRRPRTAAPPGRSNAPAQETGLRRGRRRGLIRPPRNKPRCRRPLPCRARCPSGGFAVGVGSSGGCRVALARSASPAAGAGLAKLALAAARPCAGVAGRAAPGLACGLGTQRRRAAARKSGCARRRRLRRGGRGGAPIVRVIPRPAPRVLGAICRPTPQHGPAYPRPRIAQGPFVPHLNPCAILRAGVRTPLAVGWWPTAGLGCGGAGRRVGSARGTLGGLTPAPQTPRARASPGPIACRAARHVALGPGTALPGKRAYAAGGPERAALGPFAGQGVWRRAFGDPYRPPLRPDALPRGGCWGWCAVGMAWQGQVVAAKLPASWQRRGNIR